MRNFLIVGASLAACIVMLGGCNTHSYTVSQGSFLVQDVKKGDTLQWHNEADGDPEFAIQFVTASPCGSDHMLVSSSNGAASCKVVEPSYSGAYYIYQIVRQGEHPLGGPISCSGCLIQNGPPTSRTSSQSLAVKPRTSAPALISCNSSTGVNSVTALTPPSTGITWLGDSTAAGWEVDFPPAPAPQACTVPGPFNVNNTTCTFADSTVKNYTYKVKTTACPTPTSISVSIP